MGNQRLCREDKPHYTHFCKGFVHMMKCASESDGESKIYDIEQN